MTATRTTTTTTLSSNVPQEEATTSASKLPPLSSQEGYKQKYAMYMSTIQSVAFAKVIEAQREVLTDCNITFDLTGMKIMSMDGLKTSLINLRLFAENFEEYHCQDDEVIVGVNMGNMHKLIKSIENNDLLTLFVLKSELYVLHINIQNPDKNRCTTFALKLLDLDHQQITVPTTEFKSVITLPSNDFSRIARDMLNISESVKLTNYGTHITLSCKGDFADQETSIYGISSNVTASADDELEVVSGTFSLKHLCLFCRSTGLCNCLEIFLKPEYPLLIKFQIASLGRLYIALCPLDEDVL